VSTDTDGPATQGPPALPAPPPNGLFAGPPGAPDTFELLGEGQRGGEGITWRASYHGALRSAVPLAVKALDRPADAPADWPSPELLQRWKDRTVLLQHLHLERVVWLNEVFVGSPPHRRGEAGDGAPVPYLVMEWVEGPTLAELAGGSPATAATIGQRMQYVREAAEALHALHTASRSAGNPSLHRDVKPTNCIVHPARGVVLIDVGGMRTLDDGFDPAGMHTAAYTAPEILRNPYVPREAAGDRYALGALAVFCLLGEDPPAGGAALPDLIAPRLLAVAREAGVAQPDALVAHVLAMLRSDPGSRPADGPGWARELRRLTAVSSGRRTTKRTRRRGPAVAASTVAAVLLAGGVALAAPWDRPADQPHGSSVGQPRPSADVTAPVLSAASGTPSAVPSGLADATGVPVPAGTTGLSPVATTTAGRPTTKPPNRTPTQRATTPPAVTSSGSIASPAAGTEVMNCAYFAGSARLAAGETLVLAMRNLDNGDPGSYVEYVFGWDEPSTLASWRGAQYFGGAEGQEYEVALLAVELSAAQAARTSDGARNALVASGTRLAARKVTKTASSTGDDCPGPG
jgi:serine/threonine-protein kinase